MILKNKKKVLSIVSSLFVKKVQSELWANNQPSLSWRVPCAIQKGNKLRHSISATFDAEESERNLINVVEWKQID